MDECSILAGSTSDNCIRDRQKPNQTWLYISVAIVNQMFLIGGLAGAWSSPVLMKLQLNYSDASTVASKLYYTLVTAC
ncbi:hypothetical protein J6590_104308 [Homalodisca vitripennis]|nr:hypothetical protein J6590_104308 [Homalodisca vitripennis]